MTADDIETAAQQLHSRRHRAGTAPTCGRCRDTAAGWPRRTRTAQLLAALTRPHVAALALCAVVLALTAVYAVTGATTVLTAAVGLYVAVLWLQLRPGAPTPTPTK